MKKKYGVLVLVVFASAANAQSVTTFTYDPLGRLVKTEATSQASSEVTEIGYDAAGNRKLYKVLGASEATDDGAGASVPSRRLFVVVPLNGFTLIPVS